MLTKNKTSAPNAQSSVFPSFPKLPIVNVGHEYDDPLCALAQFIYLDEVRKRHRCVTIEWFDLENVRHRRYIGGRAVRVAGLSEFIKGFPRQLRSIFVQVDDDPDWWSLPFHDFTPPQECIAFLDEYDAHDWRDVIRRYAPALRSHVTGRVAKGWRSDVIFKIGMTLRERGASAREIACVLRASRCWQDKHGDNERALEAEVARIMSKGRIKR
jgi:hypothetical protein